MDEALAKLRQRQWTHRCQRAVVADVGTAPGCGALIAALSAGRTFLINNLGIYGACEFFSVDDWRCGMSSGEVNVKSGVRLSRHYARGMRGSGWGRIQFVSSESALNIPTEMVHYGC